MNEGSLPQPDRNSDQLSCVERYEAMLSRNDHYFFDVEEFELIIEHYLELSDLEKAKAVLEDAQRQHPGAVDLMFCEAHLLMSFGKLNRALGVLDVIAKVEPFNEDVYLHKAGIHSQLRNYQKAIDHFKRALDLAEEGLDDIHLDLAFEYENMEAFPLAIESLKSALEINPENEAVLYELAYCFDLIGNHQMAVSFFREFTNEHPYSFVAWFNMGNSLSQLGRPEESVEALDYCIAIEDRFTSAYFSKARNLLELGKLQAAVECYSETIQFDGPQAITYSYIAECYEKMESYEQALIHYDQSVALDPNWVDGWIGRGVVKGVQDRYGEALKDLEIALRLSSEHGDAMFYTAHTLASLKRYEEALSMYAKLNRKEPDSLEGWLEHAELLLELKGPDAAAKKLNEGSQVHRLNARFRYRMVSYLLRSGREQQGMLEMEEALMADHGAHVQLFEHYPEAALMPQIIHLLELYRR
ncbi:MAG: tetratricopeptide repeat protein [Flavobacteriales bacterium]|nr:tetratricopeptide repeat protein [Flavobacteriales bacterium]